jgi:hypothetical protein
MNNVEPFCVSLSKEKFACARASSTQRVNLNEEITEELQKMLVVHRSNKKRWEVVSYERAIAQIKGLPYKITTWEVSRKIVPVAVMLLHFGLHFSTKLCLV